MKSNTFYTIISLSGLATMMSSCSVVGGIFKAGAWTGIIAVVLVVALILYAVSRFNSKK
jgi:hypothetical protein